ncbi:MAG: hypothetical protein ABSA83_06900 [Verrucomicrobiota bacterium]
MQSWTPRRPSGEIARRLFGTAAPAAVLPFGAEIWRWLAPAAACLLTLMVVTHDAGRRLPRSVPGNAAIFATLMRNAATSNAQQTFVLSQMDENVEWNFWPHPFAGRGGARSGLNLWSVMPTNR